MHGEIAADPVARAVVEIQPTSQSGARASASIGTICAWRKEAIANAMAAQNAGKNINSPDMPAPSTRTVRVTSRHC